MKTLHSLNGRRRIVWWVGVVMLTSLYLPPLAADPAAGKTAFDANACGSCHQMSGPVDPIPVAERASIKGPPLWFAGSKFQHEWLVAWLENPTPVRRVKYGSLEKGVNEHPSVSGEDAAQIGAYLMSVTDAELETGVVGVEKLTRRKSFKAEKLFAKKQVCFGCHLYPSKQGEIGGFTGPSLVEAGTRLMPDWILGFLKDNVRYYPNGRMPVYGEHAFDPFSDDELILLTQFIGSL